MLAVIYHFLKYLFKGQITEMGKDKSCGHSTVQAFVPLFGFQISIELSTGC